MRRRRRNDKEKKKKREESLSRKKIKSQRTSQLDKSVVNESLGCVVPAFVKTPTAASSAPRPGGDQSERRPRDASSAGFCAVCLLAVLQLRRVQQVRIQQQGHNIEKRSSGISGFFFVRSNLKGLKVFLMQKLSDIQSF